MNLVLEHDGMGAREKRVPCGHPPAPVLRRSWPMSKPSINERMVAHMERLLVTQGYSPQTRDTYIRWTQRFTKFLGYPHPRQIGTKEIAAFLDHLANDRGLAAATRNQAAAAIKFLMREVLASDAADSIKNSKGPKYVPTVLSHAEASMILREMSGRKRLACRLQYGTGMRIGEALSLRIKDIDFELARIDIQDGKGGKGRVLMLPNALRSDLRNLIDIVTRQHKSDMERGAGWVSLPDALHLKKLRAGYELGWQFLFNSRTLTRDPATKRRGRFQLSHFCFAEGVSGRRETLRLTQAGNLPHTPALLCNRNTQERLRPANAARVTRSRRYPDDDDLHSRRRPGRHGGPKSVGQRRSRRPVSAPIHLAT